MRRRPFAMAWNAALANASTMAPGSPSRYARQRREVGVGVGQQTGRHGNGHVARQAFVAELRMHQGTTGAAVAVRERMDRLELRVRQSCVSEQRDITTTNECHEVRDRRLNAVVVGRNEERFVGSDVAAADPHLLPPPPAGDLGRARFEERRVHGEDRVGVDSGGERDRRRHRAFVRDDHRRVVAVVVEQLGFRDGSGRGGQVLDLGRRGRLRSQQHRGERRDLMAELRIEPGDLGSRVLGLGCRFRREEHPKTRDVGDDRGRVRPAMPTTSGAGGRLAVARLPQQPLVRHRRPRVAPAI